MFSVKELSKDIYSYYSSLDGEKSDFLKPFSLLRYFINKLTVSAKEIPMKRFLIGQYGGFDEDKYTHDFRNHFYGIEACLF